MGALQWLGQQAARLRRTRTVKPTSATGEELRQALHAPATNQQSPHSFGRKVTPVAKAPVNGTDQAG